MTLAPLPAMIDLAKRAGEYLTRCYYSSDFTYGYKPDHSIVTQADLEADRLIKSYLEAHFPEDLILSEELSPRLSIAEAEPARDIWVIDPLDGTTNFSLGLPFWGISIARVRDGWPSLAVLYYPILDELYTAELGVGASFNEKPLQIQTIAGDRQTFFSCCSRTYRNYQVDIPYKARILGSASYTFCAVARGMAAIGFEAAPKIWDLAGAWLVLAESGGRISTIQGGSPFPIAFGEDYSTRIFPVLAAQTAERLEWARGRLRPR